MTRLRMIVLTILLGAAAPSARADVIPPDVSDCSGKGEGASCPRGHCEKAKCSRIDYANWNRDASATPPSMQYDCLKCVAGASEKPAAPSDAGSKPQEPTDEPDARDAGKKDGPEGRADASTAKDADADKDSGGCSLAAVQLGSQLSALAFAGVSGFLLSRRLKRRP